MMQVERAIRFESRGLPFEEERKRVGPETFNCASSLFEPDTLMPDQYLETLKRKAPLEGEKRLMLAILEDAIACFQKYRSARDNKGRKLFREVEEWIMDEKDEQLFSFVNICESLGINPRYLRRGLKEWEKAKRGA